MISDDVMRNELPKDSGAVVSIDFRVANISAGGGTHRLSNPNKRII